MAIEFNETLRLEYKWLTIKKQTLVQLEKPAPRKLLPVNIEITKEKATSTNITFLTTHHSSMTIKNNLAATLMEGRRNAHSTLQLTLNKVQLQFPVCSISRVSGLGALLTF